MFATNNIDKAMRKAKRIERLTRATKFSSVFKGLASGKISKEDFASSSVDNQKEIFVDNLDVASDFIVENPAEKKFDLVFKNSSELPFFKSVDLKLKQMYA